MAEGRLYEVAEPTAPLRQAPSPDAPLDTEALKGERVTVYDTTDEGWAWGQLEADGYVGWLPASAIASARIRRPSASVLPISTVRPLRER